jgi:hypothetical protein
MQSANKPQSQHEPARSRSSILGLDALTFLMADVRDGVAMLPMAGQVLAKTHPGADTVALSACIITAQLVMIGIAATVGWAGNTQRHWTQDNLSRGLCYPANSRILVHAD